MPRNRDRYKSQRNQQRQGRMATERSVAEGIPDGATFVNVTELTDRVIRDGCNMTVSSTVRLGYLLVGVGIGVAGVVGRVFFGVDTLILVLVLLLGFSLVWQSMHLGMDPARRMMRALAKQDASARKVTYFASAEEFGAIAANGDVRHLPWSVVDRFAGSKNVFAITLKRDPALFFIDAAGFVRGSAEGFVNLAFEEIVPEERGPVRTAADKLFTTLDNWSVVKAASRRAEAERKAARKAARAAKRNR